MSSATVDAVSLPAPQHQGPVSLESALTARRTIREFVPQAIALKDVSQLLWAAQGITHPDGLRTAPSAGALYPLELYLVAGNVSGLPAGAYRYITKRHMLTAFLSGDLRPALAQSAYDQLWIAEASAVIALAAVESRTTRKYGRRGVRYVLLECGHAAQNVQLQATALGLAAAVVGAFDDEGVRALLRLRESETPVYLLPVGRA